MKVDSQIRKSEALIQWMDRKIDGLEISSDDRTRISAACFDIALEHQKSIVLLIANKLIGPSFSFSLVRILFEAYIRGLWIGKCATDKEIEDFKKNKLKKKFDNLIQEIEQQDGFQEGVLSKAKSANWKSMGAFPIFCNSLHLPIGRLVLDHKHSSCAICNSSWELELQIAF